MKRTVKCRLEPSSEQAVALIATLEAFAAACNAVVEIAHQTGKHRAYDLHHECYRDIKERFGLTSNYVVRAIARVAGSFGKGKTPAREFRPTSLDLDKDLIRYQAYDETVSIASINGRLKGVKLRLGEFQRTLLKGQMPKAGTLLHDKRTDKWYINMVVESTAPPPSGQTPLGVDLGINRIVATSDGEITSGRRINRTRARLARTKASLQSKKTRKRGNTWRALKRLGGKQARFTKDTNHKLSYRLVKKAKDSNSYLVIEDLTGIRQRTNHKGRRLRKMIGGWSFYQLRAFISYKAEIAGVPLVTVNPAYTSQTCSQCGLTGSRRKHLFSCKSCGYVGDSELNASLNIALRGRLVFTPEVACS